LVILGDAGLADLDAELEKLFPNLVSFILGQMRDLPSSTQGRSRVPKLGPLGSVRGAVSDDGPYRDPILQINFPVTGFEFPAP
jgi:hypothetical protein